MRRYLHQQMSLLTIVLLVSGCNQHQGAVDSTAIVGTWSLTSSETLENGHLVEGELVDEYKSDGSFESVNDSKLIDGGTNETIVQLRTTESGTWGLQQGQLCKSYLDAEIVEFKSYSSDVTREQTEASMKDLIDEKECYRIVSVTPQQIVMQHDATGAMLTLNKRD